MLMPAVFGENLFDNFFDNNFFSGRNPLYGKHEKDIMKTDVREKDGNYEVFVDLPGFKKEDVTLNLENGYLTITAEKGLEKDEDEKGSYVRKERWSGSCSRSFYLGDGVRAEDIKAKMEDGILTLTFPKEVKKLPEKNTILIEG
ncbi:MAG: Hsp20/alpha crystallin family protein [Candidatus Faecivivens sp.]|nr:Hsp20/alpha crystallin family protein [Oscillospiraceae bacterium]MDY2712672.1 Hsp20/alpha crystallin family protein [Candidatus Faecivivens sp.]